MPPLRHPRLLAVAVATAVVLPLLGVSGPAAAEEAPPPGTVVVGELVQGYRDPAPHEQHEGGHVDDVLLSWVRSAPGEAVRVPTEDVADVEVGATVEVTLGDPVADEAAQEGMQPALEVLAAEVLEAPEQPAAAPAAGAVTHEVTVVMLQPKGAVRDGTTLTQVVDAVNGPVADFWAEQSNGAVRLGVGATSDWPATASTVGCDDPNALWQEAAGRVRWTGGPGRHLLVYVPWQSPGCAYGLGTLGNGLGAGGLAYVQATATSVIAHEIGHNFGLGHASQLQCDGVVESGACQVAGYYDLYDVMGASWGQVGSLSAPHAARLGLLPPETPSVRAWAATARYTLSPVGLRTGTRAIRLTDSDGDGYWLEYRTPTGRDRWLGTADNSPRLQSGVLLRRAVDASGDTAWLLDGTPSGRDGWSSDLAVAIPPNTPVSFGSASFRVTVLETAASGALVQVAVAHGPNAIVARHADSGGAGGPLGSPVSGAVCGLRDGGCFQHYQRGSIYWSPGTGARVVGGAIRDRWAATGWENGRLGYPVTDEACGLPGEGCFVRFQGGSLYRSAATAPREVAGAVRDRWAATGWERGPLGYPVTSPVCGLRGGGCFQHFQGGSVYSAPEVGTRWLSSALRTRWAALGWENGRLGYPVTDQVCGLPGGGCFAHFQGGSVYGSPATGVHDVSGPIRDRWGAAGWERGHLGYPVSDHTCGLRGGGCFQHFERGSIYWSPAGGARVVDGRIRSAWAGQGWENGPLGYPVTDPVCGLAGGGCFVHFQGGSVYAAPETGAHAVVGRIRDAWAALGWERGLGYPVEGRRPVPHGEEQTFQRGTLHLDHRTGQVRRS